MFETKYARYRKKVKMQDVFLKDIQIFIQTFFDKIWKKCQNAKLFA